jgi:phage-related protein
MIIRRQDGLRAACYRLVFSSEGRKGRILLAVVLLEKKSHRTPKRIINLARRRRDEWRGRGAE